MTSDLHLVALADDASLATAAIRIVLADDHAAVRRSLRLLLDHEQGLEVVAEADDPTVAARQLRSHHPDVLLLNLQLFNGSSIALIRSLREQAPGTQIVVVTMEAQAAFAVQALRAGASAYVLKEHADPDLALAVRRATLGQTFVSPAIAERVEAIQNLIGEDGITARELEVLRLTALGHTAPEIARELHLAVRTVETHRANIHRKLGMRTRSELVRYALARGLLEQ
jgi:DNA-binding NarL/FixJ family response regulator